MGGSNSGGHNFRGRPSVEQCPVMNIEYFRRHGLLKLGTRATVTLGEIVTIEWYTELDCILYLQLFDSEGVKRNGIHLGFQWLAHRRKFGGHQYYWVCPSCHSPCAKIYFYRWYFKCRKCHRLRYASQRMRPMERIIEQGRKADREYDAAIRLSRRKREVLLDKMRRSNEAMNFGIWRLLARLEKG
jgi:hypothetical protein